MENFGKQMENFEYNHMTPHLQFRKRISNRDPTKSCRVDAIIVTKQRNKSHEKLPCGCNYSNKATQQMPRKVAVWMQL